MNRGNVLLTVTFDQFSDNYRAMGQVMLTAAEVYDWCYDMMTDNAKEAFTAGCETMVETSSRITSRCVTIIISPAPYIRETITDLTASISTSGRRGCLSA